MTADQQPLINPAPLLWRLPVVRHIRWAVNVWRVGRWYEGWSKFGYYGEHGNRDRRVLDQIWRGIA